MNELDEILKNRNKDYGDFEQGLKFIEKVMRAVDESYESFRDNTMDPVMRNAIYMIVNKLSRIAATPTHIDSWVDIQGYSKLTQDMIIGKPQVAPIKPSTQPTTKERRR